MDAPSMYSFFNSRHYPWVNSYTIIPMTLFSHQYIAQCSKKRKKKVQLKQVLKFFSFLVSSLHFFYKTKKNPYSSLAQSMEKTAFRKPGLCQIHHYQYTHGSPLAVKSCKNQKFRKKTYLIVHKNLVLSTIFPVKSEMKS